MGPIVSGACHRAWTAVRHPTRRSLGSAALALVGSAFLLGGLAQLRVQTDLDSFLPDGDPALAQYDDVARSFGGDPVVVLVRSKAPGQQLDAAHLLPLLGLEGQLAKLPDVATVYGPGTTLNQIAGQTQLLLAELSGRRDGIRAEAVDAAKKRGESQAKADQAGQAALDQFDLRYGKLLVQALPAGLPTLRNAGFVKSVVYGTQGNPKAQWRFIVPSNDSVAILVRPRQGLDETSTRSLVQGVRDKVGEAKLDAAEVRVSGVPVIISSLGDQVRAEIPLLGGIAVLGVSACFFLIPWTRRRRRLLPVVTTLIAIGLTLAAFGWLGRPVSLGVVAFLSVLLGIGSYYPTYFAQRAGRRVVLVVVAASAASFATLTLSPLPFVRDLGLAMALGVLLSAGTGLLLVSRGKAGLPPRLPERPAVAPSSRRVRFAVGAIALVVAGVGWAVLPQLRMEGSLDALAAGLPAVEDARGVEAVMGSSGELDVVLRGNDVLSPAAIAWSQQAQNAAVARHGDEMRPVVSPPGLLPFLGPTPTAQQIVAGVRLLPPYLASAVFREDNKVALLSYGVKLEDVGRLQALRDDLRSALPAPPPGYTVEVTGLPMAAVRGNELLSGSRVLSNTAGIAVAGLVLLVGLRRREDALRAVLAAVLATGAGLCLLWVAGIALSPITVALGSLTAAVGCEFTVLLSQAARDGSRVLRRSVLLAAATSTVGYLVLLASGLAAIREFGVLLAVSVLLALASAWCVVWATSSRPSRRSPESTTSDAPRQTMVGARG
jgi:predicted RND superfamily exporter protein